MSETEIPVKRGKGRPKGSRNKASIDVAQDLFDDNAAVYAGVVLELATDKDTPATVRLAACKLGLGKSLADDKEKAPIVAAAKSAIAVMEEDNSPKIYMTATDSEL